MYEFKGVVKSVGEVQTFASGFTKRELVVIEDKEGSWQNVVAFTFKKDNVSKLDGIEPGTHVTIGFAVDGREWNDPKTGKTRCFCDLTALKLEVADSGDASAPAAQPAAAVKPAVPPVADNFDDDTAMPF